jgi:arabinan endo-1,5-alpha-L-arabinosidase
MSMSRVAALLGALVFAGGGAFAHAADSVRVHDPVMIRQGDTYYLFGTGMGITVRSSKDMQSWKDEPPVFERAPEWTFAAVPGFKGHIWAPDISEHGGTYYLYYAISLGGKITSAIGVATNKTLNRSSPDFGWVDRGMVLQSVLNRDLWNAIDPQLVIDEHATPWLVFGSFWSGLKLVKLQPDFLRVAEPQEWYAVAKRERSVLRPDVDPEPAAIEAPFIFRKGDYYYLFVSWDYCCRGIRSDYKMLLGRSRDVKGPYLDRQGKSLAQGGGTLLLAGNARWPGVGHNSAYTFDGRDYLVFHAYDARDGGKSKLKILEMKWDGEGWPLVDGAALL